MIERGLSAFRNKRILLLQGPVGPFFHRLTRDLRQAGAQVIKINFNGGDWLLYRRGAIAFRGDFAAWPAFFERLLDQHRIDTIMMFGDCRIFHTTAYDIARRRGLEVGVFEEGYFRPDYVTLEREGVNGYSALPADPAFYRNHVPARPVRTDPVGSTFRHAALWACLYYLAAQALRPWFRKYRHHRSLSILEAGYWIRGAWRKGLYAITERGLQRKLTGRLSGRFFLVPLQVHGDAQMHVHSEFRSVEAFIHHAVISFAQHAPADAMLVVKHHPMDRGYSDYARLLRQLASDFGLGKRLLYLHDQHLPSLLQHAVGVVVVNSTVGLSALYHGAPVKVCGSAIYNFKGLAYQDSLDRFWQDAQHNPVDGELFRRFRSYIIEQTQLNGSFYKRLPIPASCTGMRWEERWQTGDPERRATPRKPASPDNRPVTDGKPASASEQHYPHDAIGVQKTTLKGV